MYFSGLLALSYVYPGQRIQAHMHATCMFPEAVVMSGMHIINLPCTKAAPEASEAASFAQSLLCLGLQENLQSLPSFLLRHASTHSRRSAQTAGHVCLRILPVPVPYSHY